MKKALSILMVLMLIFTLAACRKDTEIKKDSNGNVTEQVFYQQDGKVDMTFTYTYYESGAVHTKKLVSEPNASSDGDICVWVYAEDGKSYQRTDYTYDGVIEVDEFVELYEKDSDSWRRRKTTTYFDGEWSTTSLDEMLDDGTISVTDLTQDGKVTHVYIYDDEWNMLSKAYYNEDGVLADLEEYNVDGYLKKHTYYHSDGTTFSEYTDDSGKMLKYAFLAANGIFTEHALTNTDYTLDVGYRGDIIDGVAYWDFCVIYEVDENGITRAETMYYYATGTPASIEKFDENHKNIQYSTYHENGSLLSQATYSAPDVMTAYTVYDETGSEVFHYDCSGTQYTLSWQFYEDGTMRIYVMQEMQTIASYLFSGSQLIEEILENN